MHKFQTDFYGGMLKTCIVNYIRPEQSYSSLGKNDVMTTASLHIIFKINEIVFSIF